MFLDPNLSVRVDEGARDVALGSEVHSNELHGLVVAPETALKEAAVLLLLGGGEQLVGCVVRLQVGAQPLQ